MTNAKKNTKKGRPPLFNATTPTPVQVCDWYRSLAMGARFVDIANESRYSVAQIKYALNREGYPITAKDIREHFNQRVS